MKKRTNERTYERLVSALRQGSLPRVPARRPLREEGQVDGVLGPQVDAAGPRAVRGSAEEQEGRRREGQAQGERASVFFPAVVNFFSLLFVVVVVVVVFAEDRHGKCKSFGLVYYFNHATFSRSMCSVHSSG